MALTREQLMQNVDALEKQGASRTEVQQYINSASKGFEVASTPERSALGRAGGAVFEGLKGAGAVGLGVGKGAVSSALGLTSALLPGGLGVNVKRLREQFKPVGAAERAGFGAEQVGEFFLPVPGSKLKAAAGAGRFAKAAVLGKRAAGSAAQAGLVTAAQTAGDVDEVTKNTLLGGGIPIVGAAVRPGLKAAGLKIERSLIRPSKTAVTKGFDEKNVFKYGLGGTLRQTADKTHRKITELSQELDNVLKGSDYEVNVNKLLAETRRELTTNQANNFLVNGRINNAIKTFQRESKLISRTGIVDLPTAQRMKRSTGKVGSWMYGQRDPESNALETVANTFYTKLRKEIEKSSPLKIKRINKQLSELIPIENAVIQRLPVAERQNLLSLTDVVSSLPAFANANNWWLFVVNRLAKSGRVAEGLVGAGERGTGGRSVRGVLRAGVGDEDEER